MMIKFRRKSNGEILSFDEKKDKKQIKTMRMSRKFQELVKLGG